MASSEFGSRKARTILKVLALSHNRVVSVDRLVDAAWPNTLPASPSEQVAVLISRLRAVVGRERIAFDAGGYRLDIDWLDVDALDADAERAFELLRLGRHREALDTARRALALDRGPLLPEDGDAEWTEAPRAAAARAIARAMRTAASAALGLGEFAEASELSERALDRDLFDEEALRQLMVAEQRRGRVGAGLAAYARVRAFLADELGADPSRETNAVHATLLADERETSPQSRGRSPDVAVTPDPPTGEPAASGAFVGRRGELARLRDEFARAQLGRGRLVVVEGEAGIGKSALVSEFGRQVVDGGALWLRGTCEPFFGGLPMQAVIDALSDHVRTLAPADASALLSGEHAILGPLLGRAFSDEAAAPWQDADTGLARLLHAFDAVFARLTTDRAVVLTVDDVHLAGASTAELLAHLAPRRPGLLVVAARRPGDPGAIASPVTLRLDPLALHEVVTLIGPERAAALHSVTGGNPLFLTQLAAVETDGALPTTLVESVVGVARSLGDSSETIVSAAVLGMTTDVELLASVLRVSNFDVLAHLEQACNAGLLLDDGAGSYMFRHALVREALAESVRSARAALLHREAARVLRLRSTADPLVVARHAQLGGDRELAATALDEAARLAAQRFDRAAAEAFLDRSLEWSDTTSRRLARARTRTMRGRYNEALADVEAAVAGGAGAAAMEAGAWAAYFARRPDDARSFADDGAALAEDDAVRASCLAVAGRVRHAAGELGDAEPLLVRAVELATGAARAAPRVWLGVLRSHQGRPTEALGLLRSVTRVESGNEHTAELLHALLFTAHAFALQGKPQSALDALARYDTELGRREVPRFAGRASNFRGWVLRALGQWDRADDANLQAIDELGSVDFPETAIAAHLDLAASALLRGDAAAADKALSAAAKNMNGNLTFGWRLDLRLRLDRARLGLRTGAAELAAADASDVAALATRLGVPRYGTVARLVALTARRQLGEPVDLEAVARDVDRLPADVGIDAWWVAAEVSAGFNEPRLRNAASSFAAVLGRAAAPDDGALSGAVARLLG